MRADWVSLFAPNKGKNMALLNEGDAAPDFTVQNQQGNEVSLAQFSGRKVLLWWYPKADTPG